MKLLQKGIDNKCCNGILIKLNQIGTVTETLETIHLAQANNYKIAVLINGKLGGLQKWKCV